MAHNHTHRPPPLSTGQGQRYRETIRITLIGSVIDLVLGVAKIIVGILSHSQALIADGIHSLSDLATDAIVIYAAKHASLEADEEHPYGHGRIETVATVVLGIALISVAIGISYDAIQRLFQPERLWIPGFWALVVALVSVVAKEWIYHYTMRTARKYRSEMLRANAWHSRSDAISSIIVVIGVAGTMAGLPYLDALAAVGVALLIAKIGWDLGWHSLRELVDTGLERERVDAIRKTILETSGVSALHMLRTRKIGGDALVDVHVQVDPNLSASEGHHISETVRSTLIRDIPEVADVMVHIDIEDDQAAAESMELPARDIVLAELKGFFRDVPAAAEIRRIVLHYVGGRIQIELHIPLAVLKKPTDAAGLVQQFQQTLPPGHPYGCLKIYYQ